MKDLLIRERYRLSHPLGEGTSAETWLAHDETEDRQVAIKLLRVEHLENWKYLELFEREAAVLASLEHHGVPVLYDFFEWSDDDKTRLVLVQEFIDGSPLVDRIEGGVRLGEVETLQLTLGVLDVLDYLHSRNPPVYHRDIKPSNIILRAMGAPVLVDFGSVCDGWRPTDERGSTIVGTHGFMPPEQYLGQIAPSSDLYALGATLLYLVSGRHPRDFPFDSGRIEVPDDLPTTPAMKRLITALLEPAPRDRPASARVAREILVEAADTSAKTPSTALVRYREGHIGVIQSDEAPRPVDVGPPGRDPKGALAPVYRNLVPSHMRTIQLSAGKPGQPAGVKDFVLYAILLVCTFGLWPIVTGYTRHKRRKQYEPLFKDGQRADGVVVSVTSRGDNSGFAAVGFDFEVDGKRYRGNQTIPSQTGKYMGVGDAVSVLYNPDDPRENCFVFE